MIRKKGPIGKRVHDPQSRKGGNVDTRFLTFLVRIWKKVAELKRRIFFWIQLEVGSILDSIELRPFFGFQWKYD